MRERINTGRMLVGIVLGVFCGLIACDEEEDDGIVACYYEERSSACGGGSYGDWEARCVEIENGKPCHEVVKSDTVCASDCCVNFQVQGLEEVPGRC